MDADPHESVESGGSADEPLISSDVRVNYVSVTQAASRLGCTEQHIRKLCREGQLTSHRSGDGRRTWLVSESDVEALVSRRPRASQRPDDDVFTELELASVRLQVATLQAELADSRAKTEVALSRVAQLERELAESIRRVDALVGAQNSLLSALGSPR